MAVATKEGRKVWGHDAKVATYKTGQANDKYYTEYTLPGYLDDEMATFYSGSYGKTIKEAQQNALEILVIDLTQTDYKYLNTYSHAKIMEWSAR